MKCYRPDYTLAQDIILPFQGTVMLFEKSFNSFTNHNIPSVFLISIEQEAEMSEEKTFTKAAAHLHFAKQFTGKIWELLEKPERTLEEDELLVDYTHASLTHWRVAGTEVHLQRGAWMLAHVYTVLSNTVLAMQHAQHCFELTEKYIEKADKAGAAIKNEEDREIFLDDFNGGEWYGAK